MTMYLYNTLCSPSQVLWNRYVYVYSCVRGTNPEPILTNLVLKLYLNRVLDFVDKHDQFSG